MFLKRRIFRIYLSRLIGIIYIVEIRLGLIFFVWDYRYTTKWLFSSYFFPLLKKWREEEKGSVVAKININPTLMIQVS